MPDIKKRRRRWNTFVETEREEENENGNGYDIVMAAAAEAAKELCWKGERRMSAAALSQVSYRFLFLSPTG